MKQNVIICIPSLEYGGAERVTTYIAHFFKEKYNVFLMTTKEKNDKEYKIDEKIIRLVAKNRNQIRDLVKSVDPSFILIMFAPMAISIVPAIIGLKIPIIISERNDPRNFAGKKITKILYQFMMKFADGLVFQTSDAMKYYGKVGEQKGRVIYNPLRLTNFPEIYTGERKKIIVNVGRLHFQKNQFLLMDAFSKVVKRHPDYILRIYGEGELRADLENHIKELNLENHIFLMGSISNILEVEKDNAFFVLTSDFEGMPNALIEAMALGMPVISTDCPCGGPKELITNNENGILVPTRNVEALIIAMEDLIEHPDKAELLGENASKIRNLLDEKIILQQWLEFCEGVKEKKR